jgi:hypothetical protein
MNYDRALQRMTRIAGAIGVAGVLITLIWHGPRVAVGFLAGAILSMINLRWWTGLANALGPSGKAPRRGSAVLLGLRYVVVGTAVYVIVKILEIAVLPVLAGLLVSVAAVLIEILYELISSE